MHSTYNKMRSNLLIFTFAILFTGMACTGNKEASQSSEQSGSNLRDTQTVSQSDTVPVPTPPPPQPGLPPGQAMVKGEIVEYYARENPSSAYFILKVNKILGYGSSTPPIAATDTIRIFLAGQQEKLPKIGKIVNSVISYRLELSDSTGTPRWTLIKFLQDSN